jgi:prolyl 4-hydroxylase
MLNLQDLSLNGAGDVLRSKIWDETKTILQHWAGVELSPTSLYGVRIYTAGSILAPHVDRNPLIISAIINVAQKVDEDWPLEVIGHDGMAYNITMEVGDIILYESHSVIHGRPFPLNGEYYANVFCHFEPLGYSSREGQRVGNANDYSLERLYQKAWERQRRQKEEEFIDLNAVEMMPYYIVPGSREGKRWMETHSRAQLVS